MVNMNKCKECKDKIFVYMGRNEYNTFSPLAQIKSYDDYKKQMYCKKCSDANCVGEGK